MPKIPVDYQKSLIYKIYCNDENVKHLYIGKTTDIIRRKWAHKRDTICSECYLYETIRSLGGWQNWKMEIIEFYSCTNNKELLEREQFWINTLEADLNTVIKFDEVVYKKQWYLENKIKIRARQAEYRKSQIVKKLEEAKQYVINYENLDDNPIWFLNNLKNQRLV